MGGNMATPLCGLFDACGEFTMQLDISESLYHCIRVEMDEGKDSWLKQSGKLPLVRALAGIVQEAAPAGDTSPNVSAQRLRKVVMERNTMLGTESRVLSIQASSISVCGSSDSCHPSRWVDFGAQRIVLSMGSIESHPPPTQSCTQSLNLAEEVPELVEIPYSCVGNADVEVLAATGTTAVRLALSHMPPSLLEGFNSGSENNSVLLKFPTAEFVRVMTATPCVASALQRAGIPVGAACNANTKCTRPPMDADHAADLSQPDRPRKVSM